MLNLIVDGKNLCYRSSVAGADLVNPQGNPVGVVHTFLRMLQKSILEFKPDRVIVAWDDGKSDWRLKLYPAYKIHNPTSLNPAKKDYWPDVTYQTYVLREDVLPLLPVMQFIVPGEEADDLIYAASKLFMALADWNIILSTDHDFFQLLGIADVCNSTDYNLFTRDDFLKKFEFPYERFVSYRAMVGDTSDEIKGVQGIGKKTATKILQDYDTIEDFLADEDVTKVYRRDALVAGYSDYLRNYKLISLEHYPKRKKLLYNFMKKYNACEFLFMSDEFKQYLFLNKMLSILGQYDQWVAPFQKLEN